MRKFIIFITLAAAIAGAAYYFTEEKRRDEGYIVLYGNVDVRQVDMGFRVSGRVSEMFFEEGDVVRPGDLLGRLDKEPYLDEILQAEANTRSIEASLKNAQILYARRNELVTDGSVSQEDYDNALANVFVYNANLHSAIAAVAVAKSNLAFTEVYAPTEGTILSRVREPGTVVNPGDPIYTISVANPVWIRAFVPEPYLGQVYPGMSAVILTDTEGGPAYTGTVGFISPVAEFTPKTVETTQLRTDLVYRLRIYADDPDRGLRQGMPVTVKLALDVIKKESEAPEGAPRLDSTIVDALQEETPREALQ
jgi:HlyD family secretion protein